MLQFFMLSSNGLLCPRGGLVFEYESDSTQRCAGALYMIVLEGWGGLGEYRLSRNCTRRVCLLHIAFYSFKALFQHSFEMRPDIPFAFGVVLLKRCGASLGSWENIT